MKTARKRPGARTLRSTALGLGFVLGLLWAGAVQAAVLEIKPASADTFAEDVATKARAVKG